jgi:hypothetical protein
MLEFLPIILFSEEYAKIIKLDQAIHDEFSDLVKERQKLPNKYEPFYPSSEQKVVINSFSPYYDNHPDFKKKGVKFERKLIGFLENLCDFCVNPKNNPKEYGDALKLIRRWEVLTPAYLNHIFEPSISVKGLSLDKRFFDLSDEYRFKVNKPYQLEINDTPEKKFFSDYNKGRLLGNQGYIEKKIIEKQALDPKYNQQFIPFKTQ